MSLRAKILLLFLVLAIAPLLAVAGSAYVQSQRALSDLMESRIATLTRYAALDLEAAHDVVAERLDRLAGEAWVLEVLSSSASGEVGEEELDRAEEGLEALWPYLSSGIEAVAIRGRSGELLHRNTLPIRERAPPRQACPADSGSGVLTIRRPVRRGEGPGLGEVQAQVHVGSLLRPEVSAPFGEDGFLAVLDRTTGQTVLVSGCRPDLHVGRLLSQARSTDGAPLSVSESGSRFTFEEAGAPRLGAFERLEEPAWTVVMTGGTNWFLDPFRELQNGYALFVALIALSTALAFSLSINQVMRSLEDLGDAADRIGQGELDPWLPPPSGDEVGRLSYAVGRMAERIRQMVQQVDRSSRMAVVGEMASYLAHEIRNPLSSIKLNLQSMARDVDRGSLPPDTSHEVDVCLREVARLERVVSSVLKLGNAASTDFMEGSLHSLLADSVELVQPDLDRLGVVAELDLRARQDAVLADFGQLKGVVLNLVLNAADAMPDGGIVEIRTRTPDSGEGAIIVEVTDQGPGVPAEFRDRIFEPFFTTKADGSGIGLSLAARAVEEHGGGITLAAPSGLAQGATFTIELPLATQSPRQQRRSRPVPTPSRETGLRSRRSGEAGKEWRADESSGDASPPASPATASSSGSRRAASDPSGTEGP